MAAAQTMVEPKAGELQGLAASYLAEAKAEETLAENLAKADMSEAATKNRHRAQRHRRTADILAWLASFDERGAS